MKVLLALLFAIVLVNGQINMDCNIIVPAAPLTATGLATPYQLLGAVAGTVCNQGTDGQTAFVEACIYDSTNIQLLAYHPLVIDQGTVPLVVPTPIAATSLPQGSTVGIWFGSNGNNLFLTDNGAGSLTAGSCTNGILVNGVLSVFGQYAYCNAITFMAVVQAVIAANTIVAPPLGIATDGLPCPTTRDFSHVDMDPSDNVVTTYLVGGTGRVAQNNSQNLASIGIANAMYFSNPSDNRLLGAMDAAYGCKPWVIRNLDDTAGTLVSTLATNELHANFRQGAPIALIALSDPMTKVNNQPNIQKVNAYRAGVGQPVAATPADADTAAFCLNYYNIHPRRLLTNFKILVNLPSPAPTVADSLLTFMAQRFQAAFGAMNMDCVDVLRVNNPINLTIQPGGVLVVGATIVPPPLPGTGLATSKVVVTTDAPSLTAALTLLLLALAALMF